MGGEQARWKGQAQIRRPSGVLDGEDTGVDCVDDRGRRWPIEISISGDLAWEVVLSMVQ